MKRLDQYLLGEMLLPFVSGVLLIIVMLVGNTLFPLIEAITKNGIPLMVVAKLVAFNLPTLLVLTLPAGTAVAASWAVNRLARDSEVTAIRMAGVPLRRLFLPIFGLGLAASLTAFLVGDRVVPPANREFQQTQTQMGAYALQALPNIASNKVFTFEDYSFHIRQIQPAPGGDISRLHLDGVTIFKNPEGSGFPTLITAKSATYDHDVWTFYGVRTYIIDANGSVTYELTGSPATMDLRVPLAGLEQSATLTPEMLTMQELGTEMRALAGTGQRGTDVYNAVAYNYYAKLSLPFICLAFALFAPPLTLRFARQGAYTGLFLSILMVWVAWNTLLLGKFLGDAGKLSAPLAAWAPDALFTTLGVLFLWRME